MRKDWQTKTPTYENCASCSFHYNKDDIKSILEIANYWYNANSNLNKPLIISYVEVRAPNNEKLEVDGFAWQ